EVFWSHYTDAPNTPLFPFGFGLSYTRFQYTDLQLSAYEITAEEVLKISVKLQNIGHFDGEEVVQLYIRDLVGSVTRPVKELKGFKKIALKAGEAQIVEFQLSVEDLAFYGADMEFKAEPGAFKIFVGGNSLDLLETGFSLK
ncbi:MAG: fibronectin type III-like domain-contianing protein, partial [Pseudomonadota bacterium]